MALGCLTPPFLPVFLDSGLLTNPQEATSTVLPKEAQVSPIQAVPQEPLRVEVG